MNDFIKACIVANEEIYEKLQNDFNDELFEHTAVGAGGDVSSRLDLYAEEVFVKHLSSFGSIESEESGAIGSGNETIIIDPIDGSSNALSMFPYYGTSVAKIDKDGLLDAAVVCNLANKDLFCTTNSTPTMQGKLFSSTFEEQRFIQNSQIGLFEKAYANPLLVAKLDENDLKFRAPGAVALSLAYARSVNYVLYVGEFRIYDFAAGLALCEGLEVIVEENYVIVSKDKVIVDKIELLIKGS